MLVLSTATLHTNSVAIVVGRRKRALSAAAESLLSTQKIEPKYTTIPRYTSYFIMKLTILIT